MCVCERKLPKMPSTAHTAHGLSVFKGFFGHCRGADVHSRLNREQRDFIVRVLDTFEGSNFIGMLPAMGREKGVRTMEKEIVTIRNTAAVRETERALLVRFDDASEHWIPRSQIQPGSEIAGIDDTGNLIVSQWFADNSNLFGNGRPAKAAPAKTGGRPLENKPGRGVMFGQKAEGKQPNYKGGVNIGGREYKLAAWIEQSKSGLEYLSLVIEPVDVGEARAA